MDISTVSGNATLTSARCTSGRSRNRAATCPRSTQKTLAPLTAATLSTSARLKQHVALNTDGAHLEAIGRCGIVHNPASADEQQPSPARGRSAQATKPGGSRGSRWRPWPPRAPPVRRPDSADGRSPRRGSSHGSAPPARAAPADLVRRSSGRTARSRAAARRPFVRRPRPAR